MITKAQEALLEAIKAALFDAEPAYPDGVDWAEVIREAKAQTVLGLVSSVIPVQDESLTENIERGKAAYMRMLYEQDQLVRLLDEHKIPFVILKGCAAAMYYPKAYLRAMGDIDLLVPRDRFADAMVVLDENGFFYSKGKEKKGQLEEGSRNVKYGRNGIIVELHHHFSSNGFDIDEILEKAIERRVYRELNGLRFPTLPDVENGLVILGHINQHLRLNEIGLRQIIDWEMFFNSVMDETIWQEVFAPLAKEAGLLSLAESITGMCQKHIGLPKKAGVAEIKTGDAADGLLEIILSDGNFGTKVEKKTTEYNERKMHRFVREIKSDGFFVFCMNRGTAKWKAPLKHPILKPLAFVWGFLRFLGMGLTAVFQTGHMGRGIREGERRAKLFEELGVRE